MVNSEPFSAGFVNTLIGTGGVQQVGRLVRKIGGKKVLIVTDPGVLQAGLVDGIKQVLEKEGIEFGIFDKCEPDAPINVIKNCAQLAKKGGYDLMVGVGGGSTMDTAKIASIAATADNVAREDINQYNTAGALRQRLPKILIPTTAGTGSEVSIAAVFTDEDGVKKAVMGDCALADMAVVDPLMTLNMPAKITADSGMDALSHAIEGYTSLKSNIMSDMFAETTIKLVAENLRTAYSKGYRNVEARYNMAIAATFASKAYDLSMGANVNHSMGHTLQSMGVHCTHGVSCTVMLPHVMEFNMIANLPKYARIAELMGEKVGGLSLRDAARKAVDAVRNLASDVGMPSRLRDIGVKKEDIPKLVDILFIFSTGGIDRNPRHVTREDAANIFEAAW